MRDKIAYEEFYYNYCTIDGKTPEKKNRDVMWFKFMQYVADNDIKVGVGSFYEEYRKFLSEHKGV